jgi:hypothetical protein
MTKLLRRFHFDGTRIPGNQLASLVKYLPGHCQAWCHDNPCGEFVYDGGSLCGYHKKMQAGHIKPFIKGLTVIGGKRY